MDIASKDLIKTFTEEGASWIETQRKRYRDQGEPIPPEERKILASYFKASTLEKVRICRVNAIENPAFYEGIQRYANSPPLLDLQTAAGVTYIDTVLVVPFRFNSHYWLSLIFHECVHVVQYQMLGVPGFIRQYVDGWVQKKFDYYTIPLEKEAFALEGRFRQDPGKFFPVEKEVQKRLRDL